MLLLLNKGYPSDTGSYCCLELKINSRQILVFLQMICHVNDFLNKLIIFLLSWSLMFSLLLYAHLLLFSTSTNTSDLFAAQPPHTHTETLTIAAYIRTSDALTLRLFSAFYYHCWKIINSIFLFSLLLLPNFICSFSYNAIFMRLIWLVHHVYAYLSFWSLDKSLA